MEAPLKEMNNVNWSSLKYELRLSLCVNLLVDL